MDPAPLNLQTALRPGTLNQWWLHGGWPDGYHHLYIKKYAMTESGLQQMGHTRQLFMNIEGLWDESADTGAIICSR